MFGRRIELPFITTLIAALASSGCSLGEVPEMGIPEASGVHRLEHRLIVVGDHEPGTFYECPLTPAESAPVAFEPRRVPLPLTRMRRRHLPEAPDAADLEAVDRLADGRLVFLSERVGALFDAQGIVAAYGRHVAELGGRGPEGLAVREVTGGVSRVALLWEGGYPEASVLPDELGEARFRALAPRVVVHDIAPNERDLLVATEHRVRLNVPLPQGREPQAQRFRAPAFVWHQVPTEAGLEWGYIVLLSSGFAVAPESGSIEECVDESTGLSRRWCYKWLQRFTATGDPVGEDLDLRPFFPEEIRDANWEGMAWFDEGESLVFVYEDFPPDLPLDPQEAIVVPLPAGW